MERSKHFGGARGWVLPAALLVTSGFATAQAAGCFSALDDCESTLYFGPGCGTGGSGSTSGSGNGSGSGSGSGNGSSGTSTGGSSTSAMASGSGGSPECMTASQCQVPAGPCFMFGTATCEKGTCGVTYVMSVTMSQQYGTCQQYACDAMGQMTSAPDDMNVYDDGNPCDKYTCTGGVLSAVMQALGMACPNQTGYCIQNPDPTNAGLAICAQCADNTECTMGVTTCHEGKCVLAHCVNHVQDSTETDKDCGGLDCPPCTVGQKCMVYTDCFSQVCEALDGGPPACQQPSCTDGKQNGLETDQDCGGANTCPRCGDTLKCLQPTDCVSGVCRVPTSGPPARCATPSCSDGVQNGSETGIDCGGDAGCSPCGDGGA